MRYAILSALVVLLFGCGGASEPKHSAIHADIERLKAELAEVHTSITDARGERDALDDRLVAAMNRLEAKLARRVPHGDQLYLELETQQIADLARAFLNGFTLEGAAAGSPYAIRLHSVHARPHSGQIFLTASYSATYKGAACEGATDGYLIHLDRQYMKVMGLDISCATPHGTFDLGLAEQLAPLPLPFGMRSAAKLVAPPGTTLPIGSLEIITPLQATIEHVRTSMKASTISLRKVKP